MQRYTASKDPRLRLVLHHLSSRHQDIEIHWVIYRTTTYNFLYINVQVQILPVKTDLFFSQKYYYCSLYNFPFWYFLKKTLLLYAFSGGERRSKNLISLKNFQQNLLLTSVKFPWSLTEFFSTISHLITMLQCQSCYWILSFFRAEMKHKLNPVLDAQLNRNRARRMGHRRNLSDGGHVGEDVSIHDLIILLVASTIHHHG